MNTRTEVGQDPDQLDPRIWRMAAVVVLGPLMTSLDATVVNVSLARLGQDLQAPLAIIQWVITGYLLALALVLPISGWLVDRIGAKQVYLLAFAGFTGASMLCGLARSAPMLIGARVLQGTAGGLLAPMGQMMVAREAGRHLARVMGFMVMPILLGPIFGPVLAGFILQHASWHWIFFINLPIGLLAILLAIWLLPPDAHRTQRRPFDLTGFLLLSPGLVLLLHSLERLSSGPGGRAGFLELGAALALLAGFVRHGLRPGGHTLLDLRLFKVGPFAASAATQFMANAIAYGSQLMVPLYLLSVRHLTPSQAGVLLIPGGLGAFCSYPLMGAITERFGSRRVSATGACLALVGTLPFAWAGLATLPAWTLGLALFLRGAGMGGISIPSLAAAYAALPPEEVPSATTALNIVQRMGGPSATTALAIFLHTRMGGQTLEAMAAGARARAFTATFILLCAFHAASVLAALCLPWRVEHRARNRTA